MKRLLLLTALCFTGIGVSNAAPLNYSFSFDTSLLNGLNGFLDFQFNPGGLDAAPLTATVTNFLSVGGVLDLTSINTGDAAGTLPATLTLGNSGQLNAVFQGFQFGTALSFDLAIDGPGLSPPGGTLSGTTFGLFLLKDSGVDLFPTSDPNGTLVTVTVNELGDGSSQAFTVVPEPASLALIVLGICAFGYFRSSRIFSISRGM